METTFAIFLHALIMDRYHDLISSADKLYLSVFVSEERKVKAHGLRNAIQKTTS